VETAPIVINNHKIGWRVAGRATYAPINEKTRVIHLGAAADYRTIGDNDNLRFNQQPEAHVSGVNDIDGGEAENVTISLN